MTKLERLFGYNKEDFWTYCKDTREQINYYINHINTYILVEIDDWIEKYSIKTFKNFTEALNFMGLSTEEEYNNYLKERKEPHGNRCFYWYEIRYIDLNEINKLIDIEISFSNSMAVTKYEHEIKQKLNKEIKLQGIKDILKDVDDNIEKIKKDIQKVLEIY